MAHLGIGRRAVSTLAVLGLVVFALVSLAAVPAGATTVNDEATFRAAWTNAAETQIDLAANITLTCGGGGVAVRNSATALNLDGHGHSITQTCADNGVLRQDGTGALALQNVTITGGVDTTDFSVREAGGGGVLAGGDLISGNADNGTFGGGGIRAGVGSTTATVTNSTISGNSAGLVPPGGIGGGGIAATGPTTIKNSTITGNTAGAFGGGGIAIGVPGSVTLVYTTVVDNTAPDGANVKSVGGPLISFGSVVALPHGSGNCSTTATTSNGYNFSDDASCGFTAATDTQNGGNPNLGALANNGGPTQTRLPQTGSPLIDAVPLTSCQADGAAGVTTDQRGLMRPSGNGCDIGSVEVQQMPPTKDDCKNGGWQRFVDAQGQPFRNQGQCVSSVP